MIQFNYKEMVIISTIKEVNLEQGVIEIYKIIPDKIKISEFRKKVMRKSENTRFCYYTNYGMNGHYLNSYATKYGSMAPKYSFEDFFPESILIECVTILEEKLANNKDIIENYCRGLYDDRNMTLINTNPLFSKEKSDNNYEVALFLEEKSKNEKDLYNQFQIERKGLIIPKILYMIYLIEKNNFKKSSFFTENDLKIVFQLEKLFNLKLLDSINLNDYIKMLSYGLISEDSKLELD